MTHMKKIIWRKFVNIFNYYLKRNVRKSSFTITRSRCHGNVTIREQERANKNRLAKIKESMEKLEYKYERSS